jgi:hypothetical protein
MYTRVYSCTRRVTPHDEQFSTKVLFRSPKVHRMHYGTLKKKGGNRPTRANLAVWNVTWSPRVLDMLEKRSKTAEFDRWPWRTIFKHYGMLLYIGTSMQVLYIAAVERGTAEDLYGLDDGSGVWRRVHQYYEPSSSPYISLVRAVSQPFFVRMVVPYWVPYRPKSAVFVEKRSMDGWRNGCNRLNVTGS